VDERRTAWLFFLVLGAELVLLTSRLPADTGGSLLQALGLRLLGPVARLTTATTGAVSGIGESFASRRELQAENQRLRGEVEDLRLQITRLGGLENEVRRLASSLGAIRNSPNKLTLADVVYLDRSAGLSTLVLASRGANPELYQPVLAADGLVGRVVQVTGSYARVQLITDSGAGVGGMIERSGVQGFARGQGTRQLELGLVPRQETIEIGDRVVTSGIDGFYPPGILVGTVVDLPPSEEIFLRITVTAAVDLSRLDHVYLLDRSSVPAELKGPDEPKGGPARAVP
jgi:rod shape-determining protein MreC